MAPIEAVASISESARKHLENKGETSAKESVKRTTRNGASMRADFICIRAIIAHTW